MTVSTRALLDALDHLAWATPSDVAACLHAPLKPVRRALLGLHRAGSVDRVLLPTGVLNAPRTPRSDAA